MMVLAIKGKVVWVHYILHDDVLTEAIQADDHTQPAPQAHGRGNLVPPGNDDVDSVAATRHTGKRRVSSMLIS